MNRQKLTIFLLLAGAVVLLFVLAASLNQVDLKPGQPLGFSNQPSTELSAVQEPTGDNTLLLLVRGFVAISVILGPIALIIMLMSKQGRKRLFVALVNVIVVWLLLIALGKVVPPEGAAPVEVPEPGAESISGESDAVPENAEPPEWVTWAASLIIAVILAATTIGIWRLFHRRPEPFTALGRLAAEAQDALNRLELGEDLRETILRCYLEMVQVVKESRGIARSQHTTPHEFEVLLKTKGLPAEALMRLTRLFEEVRYGSYSASPQEEQLAILCLRDIVAACQGDRPYAA